MISMAEAAASFNKAVFTDATGANEFTGQILPFNDSTRSGATSRRRILEVEPGIVVPKVVIEVSSNEVFLVAKASTDFFKANPVRRKYPIVPAGGAYSIRTVKEILEAAPGITEWGAVHYNRREEMEDSSDYLGGYSIMFPGTANIAAGQYVLVNTDSYRAREDSYVDELGFTLVEVVKIPNLLQTLDITVKGEYDSVEEVYPTVVTPVPCAVEERTKSYTDSRMDYLKIEAGDMTVSTLHPCKVGDTVGEFNIIYKRTKEDLVNELHCRR